MSDNLINENALLYRVMSPTLVSSRSLSLLYSLARSGLVFQSQIHLKSQIQDLSSLFEEEEGAKTKRASSASGSRSRKGEKSKSNSGET